MFLKGIFSTINNMSAEEVRGWLAERPSGSYTLLDVRTPGEYDQAHIPGSKLIPIQELADRLEEVDPGKPVVAY